MAPRNGPRRKTNTMGSSNGLAKPAAPPPPPPARLRRKLKHKLGRGEHKTLSRRVAKELRLCKQTQLDIRQGTSRSWSPTPSPPQSGQMPVPSL
uniref:HDC13964 n=1 Tax=Drosophila melanogaster TaxID=7227 RepID=Q6IJY6_DROME|nr:TPA_inf: HDC13964 [Drosophila melanogaster]